MNLLKFPTKDFQITNDTNFADITGRIAEVFKSDHECENEIFYNAIIEVKRLSGVVDRIIVVVSEYLIPEDECKFVRVIGQFRSYNVKDNNGNTHLRLFVFAKDIQIIDYEEYDNHIQLNGIICRPIIYRTTPKGKVIADMLLAVNRAYGKSDYIPCISWGITARKISQLNVGDEVTVTGRIQSRDYIKNNETKTAYEVSVTSIL